MPILLGGPKCHAKRRAAGGLSVFLEWFDPKKDEIGTPDGDPALFITRADKYGLSGNRGSACITLAQAHLYADSMSGAPTMRLIEFARQAANELGLEPSRQNIYAISSAIVDAIPDLVNMPPAPKADKPPSGRPVGEASLLVDGDEITSMEMH